jgi:osmotically-inducible protein OsmY
MKAKLLALMCSVLFLSACSPAFWGGAATGVLATGAGYEVQNKRQMDRLEEDYKNERISRKEYESRKQQIEKGSIIY